MLLTRDGLEDTDRKNHTLNTIQNLFDRNSIPIINENDSVSIEELTFGDNDVLSSLVATLIHADHLILLTDTDGVLTKNPKIHSWRLVED